MGMVDILNTDQILNIGIQCIDRLDEYISHQILVPVNTCALDDDARTSHNTGTILGSVINCFNSCVACITYTVNGIVLISRCHLLLL